MFDYVFTLHLYVEIHATLHMQKLKSNYVKAVCCRIVTAYGEREIDRPKLISFAIYFAPQTASLINAHQPTDARLMVFYRTQPVNILSHAEHTYILAAHV